MADRQVITSTTEDETQIAAALKTRESRNKVETGDPADADPADSEGDKKIAKPAADEEDNDDNGTPDTKGKESVEYLTARIRRMTFENHRALDYAEEQRKSNEALQARLAKLEGVKEEAEVELPKFTDPEPDLEKADTIDQWAKDHAAWQEKKIRFEFDQKLEVRDKKSATAKAQETVAEQEQRIQAAHNVRLNAYIKEHPEFVEAQQKALDEQLPLSNPMLAHIMQSETGPALLHYLADHPKLAREIAAMNAGPALVRIGRVEALMEAEAGTASGDDDDDKDEGGNDTRNRPQVIRRPLTTATDRTPSKPPAKIGGTGGGSKTKDPSKMTYNDYKKWRASGGGQ